VDGVNLAARFRDIADYWSPRIVGHVNDYDVKLARVKGEFVRHKYDDTDELFLVVRGSLLIRMPDREARLNEGELFVVPRGTEHMPFAEEETHVLLLEPRGTLNTGDAEDARATVGEERL
jgi:mannose-6-phosphate isomerase-like protein (cupin superfamily)